MNCSVLAKLIKFLRFWTLQIISGLIKKSDIFVYSCIIIMRRYDYTKQLYTATGNCSLFLFSRRVLLLKEIIIGIREG